MYITLHWRKHVSTRVKQISSASVPSPIWASVFSPSQVKHISDKENVLVLTLIYNKMCFRARAARHSSSRLNPIPFGAEVHRSWDSLTFPSLSSRSETSLVPSVQLISLPPSCCVQDSRSPRPRILLTIPSPFSLPSINTTPSRQGPSPFLKSHNCSS